MSAVLKTRHTVPAELATASAFTRPAKTPPIQFPSRPHVEELCRTRANGDNTRWNNQVEQRATLIKVAYKEGYDAGERIGFTQSWRWHFACGAIAGAAAVGLLWGAWAPMQRVLGAWGLA